MKREIAEHCSGHSRGVCPTIGRLRSICSQNTGISGGLMAYIAMFRD